MHVMQGSGTLGRTTTHELAHQWFYGLVGNNQSRNPFLDEGMATYAEGRGENSLAEIRAMSIPPDARGQLDEQMPFWSQHRNSYYRGVYVQGAQAVASLGPVDRVDCALRTYVATNAYRIARAADLVKAMAAVFPDTTKLAPYGVTSAP
jgi:aminopeptidase N